MSEEQVSLLTEENRDFSVNLFHFGISLEQMKSEKTFTRIDWSWHAFTMVDIMESNGKH
jgi:hypothetical protein